MKKIIFATALALISVAASAQKFAHVNSQELLMLMPEMDTVRTQIEATAKENESILKDMYNELQAKAQQYQQNAQNSAWTPAIRESKERELQNLQENFQASQQSYQQDMQALQNNLTAPVMKKCQDAINKLAKSGGFIYVFDVNAVQYFDPAQSTDLTPALRKILKIKEGRTLESLQKEIQAKQQAEQQR